MKHKITISSELEISADVYELIEKCAISALEHEGIDFPCAIDVEITDDENIHEINREYRDKDSATDVLSFPMHDFFEGQPPHGIEDEKDFDTGCVLLGDMIISYERAVEQALEYGHSTDRECGFLTVHSVLHLLGYDHERGEEDTKIMRQHEEVVLKELSLVR